MQDAPRTAWPNTDLRRMMVDCQVRPFDVTDQAIIAALLAVPREKFVGAENMDVAYCDAALTVQGSTERRKLLAPMVLARLLQAADLTPDCRVLDVAGANGYSAAVIARLAGSVVALESDANFTRQAKIQFAEQGISNATAVTGALDAGASGEPPFDVILVNGAVEQGLETLLSRLAPGGRLLAIRRAPGEPGLAAKATRYEAIAGKIGMRSLFAGAATTLAPFATRPAFAF